MDEEGELLALENYNALSKIHSIDAIKPRLKTNIFSQKTKTLNYWFVGRDKSSSKLYFIDELDESVSSSKNRGLFSLNLKSGEIKVEIYDVNRDIVKAITGNNREVYGVVYGGLFPKIKFLDEKVNDRFQKITSQFPDHLTHLESWSRNFKDILVYVNGPSLIGDYILFSEGKKPKFLAKSYPDLNKSDYQPVLRTAYKADDGLVIPTLLTVPEKRQNEISLPAIILPSSNPLSRISLEFNPFSQYLAKKGYLVIQPQVRLSSGHGANHIIAGHGELGRKTISDIIDGIEHFADQNIIDSNRVCIIGRKYGGYAALAAEAFYPNKIQCVVSINGITDLSEVRNYRWKSLSRNYIEMYVGGD